jgi:hypothetical protein
MPKQLTGKWNPEIKPDIVVCDSLRISRSRVMMAIKFWERLGYDFGQIRINDTSRSCVTGPLYFEIVISLPRVEYDWNYLAVTRVYKHMHTKEILWATIQLQQSSVSKQRVLEHEIGHALGWPHFNWQGHLMHPVWQNGGYNTTGLQPRYYKKLPVLLLPLSVEGDSDY